MVSRIHPLGPKPGADPLGVSEKKTVIKYLEDVSFHVC